MVRDGSYATGECAWRSKDGLDGQEGLGGLEGLVEGVVR